MIAGVEAWLAGLPWPKLLTFFVDLAIKSTFVCLVAGIAAVALRRSSAFVRGAVWVSVVISLLLLPTLSFVSPTWNVPIIPDLASLGEGTYVPDSEKPESETSVAPPAAGTVGTRTTGDNSSFTPAGIPWFAWAILAWLVGAILFLFWSLILHAGVRSVVRRAVPADHRWTSLLDSVAGELNLSRRVRMLQSSRLNAAVTVGIFDPIIVFPSDCDDWSASRRRLVLSHELAHIKRWDTLIEKFVLLTTMVYWFNPLVWHAVRRLRIERETDCDNTVLRTGVKPSEYAELLMNVAADLSKSTTPAWQLSTISQGSNVKDRLMDILNQRINRNRGSRRTAIITGVLALALLLPISTSSLWNDATSQTTDKAKQEKAEKAKTKADWDSLSDAEKEKIKAEKQAKWDGKSPEEKSASMWEKVCKNENSAACIVGNKMKKHGVEAGYKAFEKMKQAEAGKYVFKEKEFNSLGYAFLYVEKTDEAIAVFKLNVKQNPDSWNCYDSLAEAYMVAENYDKAVKYYETAINMNPDSDHSKQQLEKLQTMLADRN
jgi:beta-lactamase regulating signal transducer with metallopeptidase domain